eukprot:g3091.t1
MNSFGDIGGTADFQSNPYAQAANQDPNPYAQQQPNPQQGGQPGGQQPNAMAQQPGMQQQQPQPGMMIGMQQQQPGMQQAGGIGMQQPGMQQQGFQQPGMQQQGFQQPGMQQPGFQQPAECSSRDFSSQECSSRDFSSLACNIQQVGVEFRKRECNSMACRIRACSNLGYNNSLALCSSIPGCKFNRGRVGAGTGNPGEIRTNAIASLSAYAAVRIKARVAAKSDRRTFRKKTGEGCFFNVDLCDADGGEIRGTFWGEECDKFFSVINEGAVYIIQNGDVKNANKKFNPNAEYEITFNKKTIVTPVEDGENIPRGVWKFKPISSLTDVPAQQGGPRHNVDVMGVVTQLDAQASEIIVKATGQPKKKREMVIADETAQIRWTAWGDAQCQQMDEILVQPAGTTVVFLKGAGVGDFQGRTISGGTLTINPDDARNHALQEQYMNNPQRFTMLPSLSSGGIAGGGGKKKGAMNLEDAYESVAADLNGNPADGSAPREVAFVDLLPVSFGRVLSGSEREPYYLACPHQIERPDYKDPTKMVTRQCLKKLEKVGMGANGAEGGYTCGDGHHTTAPMPRWIAKVSLCDPSGSAVVTAFDEPGKILMADKQNILGSHPPPPDGYPQVDQQTGMAYLQQVDAAKTSTDALHLMRLWERKETDPAVSGTIDRYLKAKNFTQWQVTLKAKKSTYNDNERIDLEIFKIKPLDLGGRQKEVFETMEKLGEINNGNMMCQRALEHLQRQHAQAQQQGQLQQQRV